MSFEFYFEEQLKKHPSMQFSDAVKLCYQAALGAEHLLSDEGRARSYLYAELEGACVTDEELFERISPDVCRVNLSAWKRENLPPDKLFEAFKNSAKISGSGKGELEKNLEVAHRVLKEKMSSFDEENWQEFLNEYKKMGCPPIHHSNDYRGRENPHYRIVKITELEKIL